MARTTRHLRLSEPVSALLEVLYLTCLLCVPNKDGPNAIELHIESQTINIDMWMRKIIVEPMRPLVTVWRRISSDNSRRDHVDSRGSGAQ